MNKPAIAYWTFVIVSGIIAGALLAHSDLSGTLNDDIKQPDSSLKPRPGSDAIECSKYMGKATYLTLSQDSNSRRFSLPRKPHN